MADPALSAALDSAYEALYANKLEDARRLLDDARRIDAKSPDVRLLEIDLLEAEGLGDEAVSAAEEACAANKKSMNLAFRFATLLLDTFDDIAAARPILEDLVRRMDKGEAPDVDAPADVLDDARADFQLEVLLTLCDCRAADLDPKGALAAAEKAVALAPDDAACRIAKASALFDLCQIDDASNVASQALDRDPRSPDAWWLRGRIATYKGDHDAADKAFKKAVTLDEERFQPPVRIDEERFAALMEASLEELPAPVKKYLKNIAITVEDVPPLERLTENDPPLSPGSLGLFEGTPPSLAPGDSPWSHFPSRITLFRRNIEISASTEDELQDLVGTTLLHEVGHYLGLDEDDLDERGLG